jgi:hypothetical protein
MIRGSVLIMARVRIGITGDHHELESRDLCPEPTLPLAAG